MTATYRWNDTQQPTNVQYRWLGDFLGRDATAEERVGGANSRRFGRQMRWQKIEINKSVRGLWEPLVDDFTQQPTKNTRERQRGYHIGRATWRGREESANSSILGRSSWEDAKKWIKIDECTNYFFFLANLHNLTKSFHDALNQSIAKRLQRGGG